MVTYKILQIHDLENCDYAFRGYKENLFNLDDYRVIYEGEVNEQEFSPAIYPELYDSHDLTGADIADACFLKFNMYKPLDFCGHSLSVSDVVQVSFRDSTIYYYCDHLGWARIN